ncbi:MAG: N-acetylglucosamine-6-phosphate deacetylase [Xenococcaceae cyanobacterium MO_188.B29]|nr:N-acetylglucosamine-6-phosphate deacetylase [Xenococcaceae cyanobacterium MO_188.B29]
MLNQVLLTNANVPGYEGLQKVDIDDKGRIKNIISIDKNTREETKKPTLDIKGEWISLGGLDLQINGGLGLAFPDLKKKDLPQLEQICNFLWQQGVDGFLPTIVTTSVAKIHRSLSVIAEFMTHQKEQQLTAKILGVHLEGPFLNYKKRGAHPSEYLLPLTVETVEQVLGNYSEIIKIITLAPELDSNNDAIAYIHSLGITVSLGHSLATAEQAKAAFTLGASMVTHAFNAMPSLHHRQPGLLGAAIINPDVYCGLIADGNHVCPTMVKILLKASNYDRGVFLVSDALAPIGLPDGVYPWDTREITVTNGTARLADGTLSGTTLPLLTGVKNLVEWGICDLEKAIALATESPRKAIALSSLKVGQPAQFIRWHWNENQQNLTWTRLNLGN